MNRLVLHNRQRLMNKVKDQLHQTNNRRLFSSNKQGHEALTDLDPKKKMANYTLALTLLGFVGGVWYYSVSAVGKGEGQELEELEKLAANKVQATRDGGYTLLQQKQQRSIDGEENVAEVAVSAPADIAEMEENKAISTKNNGDDSNRRPRPLWKRIVLFWKV